MIGIGAMLHQLGGGTKIGSDSLIGRPVVAASISDERLRLTFGDQLSPASVEIWDDGQSCCESRYMTTDDDVQGIVGGTVLRIEAKDGPTEEGKYGDEHEQVFIEVATTAGFLTLVNHNEHNGYYGGFGLTITPVPA